MEQKYIIGVDPGTGSLGLVVRDTDEDDLKDQVKYASVDIIRSGVIESGQNKYTSFAAERRGYRNARTRYLHRKWRKQETLKLLIDAMILDENIKHLLCPLSKEDLERWIRYDKEKGLKREYPVHSVAFARWLMMDFNGDGVPEQMVCTIDPKTLLEFDSTKVRGQRILIFDDIERAKLSIEEILGYIN